MVETREIEKRTKADYCEMINQMGKKNFPLWKCKKKFNTNNFIYQI